MLVALLDHLALPGPRLVVAQGLLCPVVDWPREPGRLPDRTAFPEARCLEPLVLSGDELVELATRGRRELATR